MIQPKLKHYDGGSIKVAHPYTLGSIMIFVFPCGVDWLSQYKSFQEVLIWIWILFKFRINQIYVTWTTNTRSCQSDYSIFGSNAKVKMQQHIIKHLIQFPCSQFYKYNNNMFHTYSLTMKYTRLCLILFSKIISYFKNVSTECCSTDGQ